MLAIFNDFHWLRPEWFYALVPTLLVPLWIWRSASGKHGWNKVIDSHFLEQLQTRPFVRQGNKFGIAGLMTLWLIAIMALAGPSWERQNVPVEQSNDALVIVLDLSLSQLAEDISPSRIGRARMKILDILNYRNEGLTGLVAYAGDAHVVTPLTDDTATIASMVPALGPDIMPALGSRVDLGIEKALSLAQQAGISKPHILLISDGITTDDIGKVSSLINNQGASLAILGLGTENGGPVKISDEQGLLRNKDGSIAIVKLSRDAFQALTNATGGTYSEISLDDTDWQSLLKPIDPLSLQSRESDRQYDAWYDRGTELCLILLVLALPAFRKGIIFCLVLIPSLLISPQSEASIWSSLWQRADQQGAELLDNGDPNAAAAIFENKQWKSIAHYRDGNFSASAKSLEGIDTPDANYNRGNALAQLGEYQKAIDAYQQTLNTEPEHTDALFNKALVEKLLEQQKQQEQQQQNQQNQQNSDNDEQSEGEQGDQQQQNQDPSQQNQQNDEQQDQDQQQQQDQQNDQNSQQDQNEQSSEQEQTESEQQQQQNEQASEQAQEGHPKPFDELSDEEKQTMEQWMRQIPDDPGGLLRRKFRYQYEQRQRNGQNEVPETWY